MGKKIEPIQVLNYDFRDGLNVFSGNVIDGREMYYFEPISNREKMLIEKINELVKFINATSSGE